MTRFKHLPFESTLLLLLLPLGLFSVALGRKHISPVEYLNLPQRDQFDDEFHQLVGRSLLGVDFASASSMETVCQALEEATHNEHIESKRREICKKVLDLSRGGNDCSRTLLDIYQSAWAQMRTNFGTGLGRFYTYMRVFGQSHFEFCAKQLVQTDVDRLIGPEEEFERDFFELYRRTFGLVNGGSSEGDGNLFELVSLLAKLDLVRGQFDARQMLEAAKTIGNSTRSAKDPIGIAEEFMSSRCERIQANQQLETVLDVIGWARCFESEVEFGGRLLLLAEYRRLCLAWTQSSTRQLVEANVQRQLPSLCNHDELVARANFKPVEGQESGQ